MDSLFLFPPDSPDSLFQYLRGEYFDGRSVSAKIVNQLVGQVGGEEEDAPWVFLMLRWKDFLGKVEGMKAELLPQGGLYAQADEEQGSRVGGQRGVKQQVGAQVDTVGGDVGAQQGFGDFFLFVGEDEIVEAGEVIGTDRTFFLFSDDIPLSGMAFQQAGQQVEGTIVQVGSGIGDIDVAVVAKGGRECVGGCVFQLDAPTDDGGQGTRGEFSGTDLAEDGVDVVGPFLDGDRAVGQLGQLEERNVVAAMEADGTGGGAFAGKQVHF